VLRSASRSSELAQRDAHTPCAELLDVSVNDISALGFVAPASLRQAVEPGVDHSNLTLELTRSSDARLEAPLPTLIELRLLGSA